MNKFAIVKVFDQSSSNFFRSHSSSVKEEDKYAAEPCFNALVAVNGDEYVEDEDGYASFKVLKLFDKPSGLYFNENTEFGDYVSINFSGRHYYKAESENIDEQSEMYDECVKLLGDFDKLHAEAPYVIEGRIYSEVGDPLNSSTYAGYERTYTVDEDKWTPEGVHSLDDARRWLIENHPDYYMGCSIAQQCKSGDFLAMAVPCGEYPKGSWETWEDRRKYVEMEAERLGVKIGPAEYKDKAKLTEDDKRANIRNDRVRRAQEVIDCFGSNPNPDLDWDVEDYMDAHDDMAAAIPSPGTF